MSIANQSGRTRRRFASLCSKGSLHGAAGSLKKPLRAKRKLPGDFKLIWSVQTGVKKYSVSDSSQITALFMASRSGKRGGSRVVTNAGRDVVDARALARHRGRKARGNP
jgi:hypothetical protein